MRSLQRAAPHLTESMTVPAELGGSARPAPRRVVRAHCAGALRLRALLPAQSVLPLTRLAPENMDATPHTS